MRRVRGNKGGDGEFEALKSLHGKFKIVEIESHRCYGSWSENYKSIMEVEVWKLDYVLKHKNCLDPQIKSYGLVDFTLT